MNIAEQKWCLRRYRCVNNEILNMKGFSIELQFYINLTRCLYCVVFDCTGNFRFENQNAFK